MLFNSSALNNEDIIKKKMIKKCKICNQIKNKLPPLRTLFKLERKEESLMQSNVCIYIKVKEEWSTLYKRLLFRRNTRR